MGESGKKSKKSKKKEMDRVEEMNDRTDVGDVEVEQKLESRVEKKKKKKKGKNLDAGTTEEESGLSLKKREKKLKRVDEHEVPEDTSLNVTQDEDNTVEKRKKKKTKRRKFETCENQEALNEKTEIEAKESNNVGNVEKKKKRKKTVVEESDNDKGKKNSAREEDVENSLVDDNGMVAIEKVKKKKKRKRTVEEESDNDKGKKNSAREEDVENSLVDDNGMVAIEKVKKKKKRNNEEIAEKDGLSSKAKDNEATNVSKKEKTKSVDNDPKNLKSKEKKKVRFSKDVEVFPLSDAISSGNEENDKGCLVQGKRFSKEEDEILGAAIEKYIQSHCLGEKGMEMIMNCMSHREVRSCWNEIAEALPHRPKKAVYYRAHLLFEGGERHDWTEEERQMLLEQYEKHGNNWKMVAKELKRNRVHVKDTWRRIKIKRNIGHWSQEEYQNLFDLVNIDLRAKLNEEKKSKHGMLRDNICWTAISDKLSTRADSLCCMKWYNQLTSSMVSEGIWSDADDYRLLDALFDLDACCIEDVDWDDLIDQRSGDVCRKRWDQMALHIGLHGVKSFAEQVEVLAKRYCPELLEAREIWDNKPRVP